MLCVLQYTASTLCLTTCPVPQVKFQTTAYNVSEDRFLDVFVQLVGGPLIAEGQAQALSQSGSATGEWHMQETN